VNLLFVNYGDFTTNSVNHLAGFTAALRALGHDCVVAVPGNLDSLSVVPNPQFQAATYDQLLAAPAPFADGRPADIVHAWTPREGVRRFLIAYRRLAPSRVIIHLEDNEEHLLESYMGRDLDRLREESPLDYPKPLPELLSHPVRYRNLLRIADGVTVIVDTLRDFVPPGIPVLTLPPGVDLSQYHPQASHAGLREQLMIRPEEKVIVYTGSNTFANEAEIRELFLAVQRLNAAGRPTRLVRTGFSSPDFVASLPADWATWTIDLGFIEKGRLPGLLTMADVLVQPGAPGAFNDYRLPSKLPEFLASGRPVVLPPSNLAALMTDGREAVFLPASGTPADIADAVARVLADPTLAATLGEQGVFFAHRHFDLAANTRGLADFYSAALARGSAADWTLARDPDATQSAGQAIFIDDVVEVLAASLDDPAAAQLAAQTDLLAHVVRQLEQNTELAARDRIAAEVRDSFSAWMAAFDQTTQTRANVELAQTLEEAEQVLFERGSADLLALQIRELATFEARVLEIDAISEFFRAQADYHAATARTVPLKDKPIR